MGDVGDCWSRESPFLRPCDAPGLVSPGLHHHGWPQELEAQVHLDQSLAGVFLSTSSTILVLLKTPSCTARIVASPRLLISLQSATSNDPAWRSWNMPAATFNCFSLLGLGILATSISRPASLSNCGLTTKKNNFIFSILYTFYRLRIYVSTARIPIKNMYITERTEGF